MAEEAAFSARHESGGTPAAHLRALGRSFAVHGAVLTALGLLSGFTTLFAQSKSAALSAHLIGTVEGALLFGLAGATQLFDASPRYLGVLKYVILIGLYSNWVGVQFAAFVSAGRSMFTVTGGSMPDSGAPLWMDITVAILLNLSILVLAGCGMIAWAMRAKSEDSSAN